LPLPPRFHIPCSLDFPPAAALQTGALVFLIADDKDVQFLYFQF